MEHLVDKKDLFNIEKAFGLGNIQRHPNELEGSDDNPIVFYKLQDQLKEEVALEKDDFVVIMQTEFLKHLMQKVGNKGLCCDNTHGTTGYDFKLNSLLVLGEFEEVPVAFCLSHRDDFAFMKLFFSKTRVQYPLVGLRVKLLLQLRNAPQSNLSVFGTLTRHGRKNCMVK